MDTSTARTASLKALPTEILLDIYQNLDLTSISELSLTCKHFHNVFKERKTSIILPVLFREYSPLDELLQVCLAKAEDIVPARTSSDLVGSFSSATRAIRVWFSPRGPQPGREGEDRP